MEDLPEWRARHGGLLRCCLASLQQYMEEGGTQEPGTTIGCRYHDNTEEPQMRVADDGVWEWVGPQ